MTRLPGNLQEESQGLLFAEGNIWRGGDRNTHSVMASSTAHGSLCLVLVNANHPPPTQIQHLSISGPPSAFPLALAKDSCLPCPSSLFSSLSILVRAPFSPTWTPCFASYWSVSLLWIPTGVHISHWDTAVPRRGPRSCRFPAQRSPLQTGLNPHSSVIPEDLP